MKELLTRALCSCVVLGSAFLVAGCDETGKQPSDCIADECKTALIRALDDLGTIRFEANDESGEQNRRKIREVVDRFQNPRHIASLGLLSRAINASCGGDAIC